jgi:hypothetical protein
MPWGEAINLIRILRADTTSQIAAALEGWDFPIDRAALAIQDLFDVTVMAHSDPKKGRPAPHSGRPFKSQRQDVQKFGKTGGRTRAEVVEILNGMGHNLPV